MLTIRVESTPGEEFIDVFREMQEFAFKNNVIALQKVNGIQVLVFPDSNPVRVLSNYEQAVSLNRKVVS
jgi:hypothetical protein